VLRCYQPKRRWRDRRLCLGNLTHLGGLADVLRAWKVASGAGLGALASLEVEGLNQGEELFVVAELCAGEFVEVSLVGLLLFGQHPAFARTARTPATRQ
jgi:hypothetical protein